MTTLALLLGLVGGVVVLVVVAMFVAILMYSHKINKENEDDGAI